MHHGHRLAKSSGNAGKTLSTSPGKRLDERLPCGSSQSPSRDLRWAHYRVNQKCRGHEFRRQGLRGTNSEGDGPRRLVPSDHKCWRFTIPTITLMFWLRGRGRRGILIPIVRSSMFRSMTKFWSDTARRSATGCLTTRKPILSKNGRAVILTSDCMLSLFSQFLMVRRGRFLQFKS
jgi:hypothetical protein